MTKNLEPSPFDISQQQREFSDDQSYSQCLPTPIGPLSSVEIVPAVSVSSILSSMDHTTTNFLQETFCGCYGRSEERQQQQGKDSLSTWNILASSDNDEKLSPLLDYGHVLPNLAPDVPVAGLDVVDKTPDLVYSEKCQFKQDCSGRIPLFDRCSGATSSSSPDSAEGSSLTNKNQCHWSGKFAELVEFKRRFGHCHVPNNWKENVKLSQWVKRQRHQYKHTEGGGKSSTLSEEKIRRLELLGFTWSVQEDTWEQRFNDLRAFKLVNGHTNVPKNCKDHLQLSVWVKYQRRHLRLYMAGERSSMTEERYYKLNKLGFQWNPCKKKGSEATGASSGTHLH